MFPPLEAEQSNLHDSLAAETITKIPYLCGMLCQKKGKFPPAHLLKAFWEDHKAILKQNTTRRIVLLKLWSYCF